MVPMCRCPLDSNLSNCPAALYSREINNMILVGQVSGLAENFITRIFSDTIKMINVELFMMSQLIELYLFISLSVT